MSPPHSPVSPPPLETPLAFITGASSGIGLALAEHYYRCGWRLALVARRTDVLEERLREQRWSTDRYRIYRADVSVPNEIVEAGQQCLREFGTPDLVIASAGISIGMDTRIREDLETLRRTFETNNLGLAATFHPFIDAMCERGSGRLVGIASVAGIRGIPGHGAYCASKAAVIAYCESLRGELRGTGVSVVTLLPGYIDTPLTQKNPYPMPFLLAPEVFAVRAARAIEKGTSYRVIPWQMALVAKILRILPNGLFDRLFAGRPRKPRQGNQPAE